MQRATSRVLRVLRPALLRRPGTLLAPPPASLFVPFTARCYARQKKPPPPPPQPDPITGFLPNSRKGTIQPNDPIDLFEWAPFRQWTQTETNGFNVAPRYIRDWKYFLPEVMTIAEEEGKDEVEYLPERTKLLFDPKIDKDFIKLGNFSGLDEEIRPLFTALHYIAELGHKEESRPYVKQFSSEVLKFVEFPESWTSETYKEVDLQLGKTLVKGGDVDRIVYNDKGHIIMGMVESIYDQSLQGYLDHGHHAIMGYSLGFTAHNFAFEPEGELQEEQEQEVFFWNVKNYKITLIRVNSRLSVVKQLKIGQCPQTRTALCVWPQVEGYDFFKPEERREFFVKWARVKKYLLSGKAFIGPKIVDPVEKARLAVEAAEELAAAMKRKPTFLPPGAAPSAELLKAITPEPRPDPNAPPVPVVDPSAASPATSATPSTPPTTSSATPTPSTPSPTPLAPTPSSSTSSATANPTGSSDRKA